MVAKVGGECKEMVVEVGGDGVENHPHRDEVLLPRLYRKPNEIFIS
jgi:hypothetical protein